MNQHILDPDTQAILLLCGKFDRIRRDGMEPLSSTEYHQLAQILYNHGLRPSDLMRTPGLEQLRTTTLKRINIDRIQGLLSRGASLALAVESWANRGFWIVSRGEKEYPSRLKMKLKNLAPPILYGVGNRELLSRGGIAIVGSRRASESCLSITRMAATHIARQSIQVISGGAAGIDSAAMIAALEVGGQVVGVISDSLMKAAVSGKYRDALRSGNLVLVSAYGVDENFSVPNAMKNNKYIYSLGEFALVITSEVGKGGTRAGALENMENQWTPLLVRLDGEDNDGNKLLVGKGGVGIYMDDMIQSVDLYKWLEMKISGCGDEKNSDMDKIELKENNALCDQFEINRVNSDIRRDIFDLVLPIIEEELDRPKEDQELARLINIQIQQLRIWLARAVSLGRLQRVGRSNRYVVSQQKAATSTETLPLFSSADLEP